MPLRPTTFIPIANQLYSAGNTAYTLTPLTVGTVEPLNVPQVRALVDLANAAQVRLNVSQRSIGAGGTTCEARIQYATDGATQSTWADANNTGSGLNLQTGTANTVRTTGWVNLAAGAKANDTYIRFAVVITGTVSTAPTMLKVEVQFK